MTTSLEKKLSNLKWGEFRLGELFEINASKSIDSNKVKFVKTGYNYIGRSFENNGIQGKVEKLDFSPNEANLITVTVVGQYKYVKYQEEPFYCSQNINLLKPKEEIFSVWSKKIAYFLITFIQKFVSSYNGQQSGYRLKDINNCAISLPLTSLGSIDFDFMESFIAELEAQRYAELEAYLKVTGLDDYKLTEREKQALKDFEKVQWGEFRLGDLFDIISSKKIYHANAISEIHNIKIKNTHPYVVRQTTNNGIRGYITEDERTLNDENTLSFAQDTFTVYYQKEKYFTGNKVKILKPKFNRCSDPIMKFLMSCFQKSLKDLSWGVGSTVETIGLVKISLPLNLSDSINFDFINSFVSALQKLIIKDFVILTEEKMETYRKVIGNNP